MGLIFTDLFLIAEHSLQRYGKRIIFKKFLDYELCALFFKVILIQPGEVGL